MDAQKYEEERVVQYDPYDTRLERSNMVRFQSTSRKADLRSCELEGARYTG